MIPEALLVFATFPDAATAQRVVRTLIEEQLAACGTIVPGAESIYRWQGVIETSAEVLVLFKTRTTRYPQLQARLSELHPYDVPECIAVQLSAALPAYLRWIVESTSEC